MLEARVGLILLSEHRLALSQCENVIIHELYQIKSPVYIIIYEQEQK